MSAALVVVDIDGVIADVRHRLRHVRSRPRDWDAFFAAAPQDAPLPEGRSAVEQAVADGCTPVYLTGRPERCRAATLAWLAQHSFPTGDLHMRPDADRRPARQFKVEVLRTLAGEASVSLVIDDDLAVVQAMSDAGFPVLHATWMQDIPAQQVLFEVQEGDGRT